MKPKVIVCMPAYKAETTLAKTYQALPDGIADEVIVVDDASPDGTVAEAHRLGLPIIVHPVSDGICNSFDLVWRLAHGNSHSGPLQHLNVIAPISNGK